MRRIVVLAALFAAAPAWGQSDQDRQDCQWFRADISIPACTRLLESGKLEPAERVAVLKRRAYRYTESEDWRRALRDYDAAIALDARNSDLFFFRGTAHLRLRDRHRAIDDFSKAIALKPDFDMAYGMRGDAYRELGQFQRALSDYDEALRLAPSLDVFLCRRAYAHAALKNREAAIADFRGGLKWVPDNRECLDGLKQMGVSP
jgi:tetratricopeptide (TPR) repeat protein